MLTQTRKNFKELHFTGGRFDEAEGFLDFDVLHELEVYKKILIKTAEEAWRSQHPDRKNLPASFEARFRLGICGIGKGSCTVTLERISSVDDDQLPMDVGDELDEADRLIDRTLVALGTETPLPSDMPRSVLHMFDDWGSRLSAEESIAMGEQIDGAPKFNADTGVQLKSRLSQSEGYTGALELTGEVRAASLRSDGGGSFRIRRDDNAVFNGPFTDEQEAEIIGAFSDHNIVRVRLKGEGEYDAGGELVRIQRVDSCDIVPVGEVPFDAEAPSILEMIAEIREPLSDTAFETMPTDGARNLKHYLYGWPKEKAK